MRERKLSQSDVAERAGIGQSTVSRLVRTVEAGEDLAPLRAQTRDAIAEFLATPNTEAEERAMVVGRLFAASVLEEVADLLRRGESAAPGGELPPTLRRLVGGATAGGGDAGEAIADRAARIAAERRKGGRRTQRAERQE